MTSGAAPRTAARTLVRSSSSTASRPGAVTAPRPASKRSSSEPRAPVFPNRRMFTWPLIAVRPLGRERCEERPAEDLAVFLVGELGERHAGATAKLERRAAERIESFVHERVHATQEKARDRFNGPWIRVASPEPLLEAFHI